MRNALRLSLGIAVSVACLYFATRGTDWSSVGTVLAGARVTWVLATVVVSLLTIYIRAQRWRVLLRPVGGVPLSAALSATAIGFGASSVLPFRIRRPPALSRGRVSAWRCRAWCSSACSYAPVSAAPRRLDCVSGCAGLQSYVVARLQSSASSYCPSCSAIALAERLIADFLPPR